MKKYSNLFIIIITFFFTIEVLINKVLIITTISFSLNLWIKNILPSLFPFFIISNILVTYNFTNYIPNTITNFFSKLFHIKKEAILVFFLSIVSGFPSNAKITRQMYDLNILNEKEAAHILSFTHFSNPLFILTTVSILFYHNKKIGLIILLSHYISNIIVGIILRNNNLNINNIITTYNNNINFSKVFINSIKNSIETIIFICGILTTFLIISAIITNIFNINKVLINSLLEITIGLKELSYYNLNDKYLAMLSSSIISLGGLSILTQVKAQLIDTNISIKPYIKGRIYQSIFSLILAYIFYIIIH